MAYRLKINQASIRGPRISRPSLYQPNCRPSLLPRVESPSSDVYFFTTRELFSLTLQRSCSKLRFAYVPGVSRRFFRSLLRISRCTWSNACTDTHKRVPRELTRRAGDPLDYLEFRPRQVGPGQATLVLPLTVAPFPSSQPLRSLESSLAHLSLCWPFFLSFFFFLPRFSPLPPSPFSVRSFFLSFRVSSAFIFFVCKPGIPDRRASVPAVATGNELTDREEGRTRRGACVHPCIEHPYVRRADAVARI